MASDSDSPRRPSAPRPPPPRPNLLLKHASTPIPPGLQAKMAAVSRLCSMPEPRSPSPTQLANRSSPNVDPADQAFQNSSISPALHTANSFPQPRSRLTGLAARRTKPTLFLKEIDPSASGGGAAAAGLGAGRPSLPQDLPKRPNPANFVSPFSNFSKIVYVHIPFNPLPPSLLTPYRDPSGALNFNGKAVLHAAGVNFSSGASFNINMTQLHLDEELGRGNYGTVKKVLHKPTNVAMAMKVCPASLLALFSILFLLGNPSRARSSKVERHHHGT